MGLKLCDIADNTYIRINYYNYIILVFIRDMYMWYTVSSISVKNKKLTAGYNKTRNSPLSICQTH